MPWSLSITCQCVLCMFRHPDTVTFGGFGMGLYDLFLGRFVLPIAE